MRGGKVRVPTLDGAVELAIPADTNSGRTFRLKGKGFPAKDGERRSAGDRPTSCCPSAAIQALEEADEASGADATALRSAQAAWAERRARGCFFAERPSRASGASHCEPFRRDCALQAPRRRIFPSARRRSCAIFGEPLAVSRAAHAIAGTRLRPSNAPRPTSPAAIDSAATAARRL